MKAISIPRVKLVWATPEPRKQIAVAARMTYSNKPLEKLMEDITDEEITKSVNAILERRHYSVLRHVVFMFAVSGVSRAFSHQLVRHTAGHAYEQRSQHYRTERDFNIIEPESIGEDAHISQVYRAEMAETQNTYDKLIEMGVPKDDARFVLPNGVETMLVWTANLNALVNFVQQRACRVNTPEIMAVAIKVRKIVGEHIPEAVKFMGPTCYTQGTCFEGDKFYKECRTPWRSPTVLWRPEFPKSIELVTVGGKYRVIDNVNEFPLFDDQQPQGD